MPRSPLRSGIASTIATVAVISVPAAIAAGLMPQSGQNTAAQRIVGTWQLETRTVRTNGRVMSDPVLGAQPIGRLYYDAGGRVALQMMRQGRAAAVTQPAAPGNTTNHRVALGYDSYFGTYTVNEAAGTITHKVEASLFPEDLGKDFVRPFTLEGDSLTLSFTSPSPDGSDVTRTLVFRRLK